MKLRQWQSECLEIALNHYRHISKHFLCLATPGSGKTVMAAEIAARFIEQNEIDFVLCFSPSITVSQSISDTFTKRIGARFDGIIGALGCSYTYQSILFFNEEFWQLLKRNRVMVIFDEIHHCAGTSLENSNAWGEEILLNIQQQSEYTLALTGTPWRSDKLPIVLANYCTNEHAIQCDYRYGIKDAVRDGVCRSPKIVLIDNEKLVVTDEEKEKKYFNNFKSLLNDSSVTYESIITSPLVMAYVLERGCDKLKEIRRSNVNAAGLVVASSVEHATYMINILREELNQSAVLVTYKQKHSSAIIKKFRNSTTQWIVSVGMVSEGTDIPRLQVCCHLSRVKTEMYFRQVLGRILRITLDKNQEAWLYTCAEPSLSEFSYRIEQDLPNENVIIKEVLPIHNNHELVDAISQSNPSNLKIKIGHQLQGKEKFSLFFDEEQPYGDRFNWSTLEILGQYREQVIATFDSSF